MTFVEGVFSLRAMLQIISCGILSSGKINDVPF